MKLIAQLGCFSLQLQDHLIKNLFPIVLRLESFQVVRGFLATLSFARGRSAAFSLGRLAITVTCFSGTPRLPFSSWCISVALLAICFTWLGGRFIISHRAATELARGNC